MNSLTFLDKELADNYGASDAILKTVLPGGKVIHISDAISPFKFLDACPLLYHAFEYNAQSRLQASVDASSETAVISLVRYCYTGTYLADEPDGESILLLQHAETYKIAEDFDVPELQVMAHYGFSCQIEYACCLPNPPIDLLDTIRFLYRHFASDEARRKHNLVDTLLNYCVAVYLYHKLGESLDFLTAVHEIPAFRQDLCRTNLARNFEDDCAADIIRLPSGPTTGSSNVPTTLASRELPNEMLYDLPRDPAPSDLHSADQFPVEGSNNTISRSPCRGAFGGYNYRRIPDKSKHCVSPSALAAALETYKSMSSDSDDLVSDTTADETLRRYKRAKIEEATARLEGRSTISGAGPSNGCHKKGKEKERSLNEIDEDSYWASAFSEAETKSPNTALDDQSTRLLHSDYGRNNERPTQQAPPSSRTAHGPASTTLPHRTRKHETDPNVRLTAGSASEDEGFAMVHRSQAAPDSTQYSPMSSPELIPAESIAQTSRLDKAASDDEWTML